jgi:hypothetical protein
VVELPLGLMWLPDRSFDLSDDEERLWMYAIVLREARSRQHLRALLNRRLLREMWPDLTLPRGSSRLGNSFPAVAIGCRRLIPSEAAALE